MPFTLQYISNGDVDYVYRVLSVGEYTETGTDWRASVFGCGISL